MIYYCQYCGWRINQRTQNIITPENIGKHLLYNGKAFCSEDCINIAKKRPYIMSLNKPYFEPYKWTEELSNWKNLRKLRRNKLN